MWVMGWFGFGGEMAGTEGGKPAFGHSIVVVASTVMVMKLFARWEERLYRKATTRFLLCAMRKVSYLHIRLDCGLGKRLFGQGQLGIRARGN